MELRANLWSEMNGEIMELVFSKLPERFVLRAASVCKRWNSLVRHPSFVEFYHNHADTVSSCCFPFKGGDYLFTMRDKDINISKVVDDCYDVPTVVSCVASLGGEFPQQISASNGAGGVIYSISEKTVYYKFALLEKLWTLTPSMRLLRDDPIVGAVEIDGTRKLVFAGGVVDARDEKESLAVEIYNCEANSWEVCNPLPQDFRGCASSRLMTSVVHEGRFYAYYTYAGFVSELDIVTRQWSKVRTVRLPDEVRRSYIVSQPLGLCLVAIQNENAKDLCFNVWTVETCTMQVRECIHSAVVLNALECSEPPTAAFRACQRLSMLLSSFSVMVLVAQWRFWRQELTITSLRDATTLAKASLLRCVGGMGRLLRTKKQLQDINWSCPDDYMIASSSC